MDLEPKERLETVAVGAASAVKTAVGEAGEKATPTLADMDSVQTIIEDWPAMSKKSAHQMIDKYGPPNEAIPSRVIWYNNGPWKRTIVYRDEVPHHFPNPHSDVIEGFIDYRVPPEKMSELAAFDGSVIVERTKGEVSARCDMEAANFLALNVMHDIVTGKLTVEEARKLYSEVASAYVLSRPAPYAEGFQFDVPRGGTAETDQVQMAGSMMHQAVEKVKDVLGGDES